MSRHLSEDRCERSGHLLAYVSTTPDAEMLVSFRFPTHQVEGDKVSRNLRRGEWQTIRASVVEGRFQAFATCGCMDDHSLDLFELLQRAQAGETRPRRIPSV